MSFRQVYYNTGENQSVYYFLNIMCLCQHFDLIKQTCSIFVQHPYPTEDEKRQIANQTNLTLLQVNNW